MYPLTIDGSVRYWETMVDKRAVEKVVLFIYERLEKQIPMEIERRGRLIQFRRNLFNAFNSFNVLFMINSGSVEIMTEDRSIIVRYRMSTTHASIMQLGVALIMLAVYLTQQFEPPLPESPGISLYYGILFITSIFTVNYLIAGFRIRKWMINILQIAVNSNNARTL